MELIKRINSWLKPAEIPMDLLKYVESVYDMRTMYKKDIIGPRNKIQHVIDDYLHIYGLWRMTEEVRSCLPIASEDVYKTENVFLLMLYWGEYEQTYCLGFAGFVKRGRYRKWEYIGKLGRYKFKNLPEPKDLVVNFTDENGKSRSEECQGLKKFYYKF